MRSSLKGQAKVRKSGASSTARRTSTRGWGAKTYKTETIKYLANLWSNRVSSSWGNKASRELLTRSARFLEVVQGNSRGTSSVTKHFAKACAKTSTQSYGCKAAYRVASGGKGNLPRDNGKRTLRVPRDPRGRPIDYLAS